MKQVQAMEKSSKHPVSAAAKARQLGRMLADVLKESQKAGGSVSLEQAWRELEQRERRERAQGASRPRHKRKARRS
jgi:hypothetical protein